MILGDFIHQYRKSQKMSMAKFAEISGLSKAYVSLLEKNKHPETGEPITPSVKTIKKVADAINIDFNELFNQLDGEVSIEEIPIASSTEKINDMRNHIGMSIDELCEKSGVPKGTLSKITAGITKNPSVDTVKSIVHAMGFTLDDLDDFPNLKNKSIFSISEMDHIKKYRELDTHGKEMVDLVLNKEYERSKNATAESNSDSEEKVYNIARAARGQQPLKMTEEQMKAFAESAKKAPNRSRDKDLF